jgi:tRNA-specific 2-thiouridylase
MEKNSKKIVFVGLSGGVDSAVSAALLKDAGYDVTGVYIKVWQPDWIECNWKEERRDAMRVAAHLKIPFQTLDLVKEYKKGVVDYMISEYVAGRTPNPDVMCNREVKFGAFWKWARSKGADYIATGHYARNIDDKLLVGLDSNKDQSYFLWTLNKKDLAHVLFPISHLKKPELRLLAQKYGLPNADKKDSQGLCFIGKIDVKDFIRKMVKSSGYFEKQTGSSSLDALKSLRWGNVIDSDGNVIGHHGGALTFTIGERHGFVITKKNNDDKPYYVMSKDIDSNTITVKQNIGDNVSLNTNTDTARVIAISKVNWVNEMPKIGKKVTIRLRYRQKPVDAKISDIFGNGKASLQVSSDFDSITPGQSLVIYDGDTCLGGGIID